MSCCTKQYKESILHKLSGKVLLDDWKSDSVNADYDPIWLIRCNKCLLLTLKWKAGINWFPVMGSDGVESLGKPTMFHYIDVRSHQLK